MMRLGKGEPGGSLLLRLRMSVASSWMTCVLPYYLSDVRDPAYPSGCCWPDMRAAGLELVVVLLRRRLRHFVRPTYRASAAGARGNL